MTSLDEEQLFSYVDPGQFIRRYVERFKGGVESGAFTRYDFDRLLYADGGGEGVPTKLVWGSVRDGAKHIALLPGHRADEDVVRELQTYLRQLTANPSEQTVTAFVAYLRRNYSSITPVSASAMIELPDPTVPKIGDYPVVDVILYAEPDGRVRRVAEATLRSGSFTLDDPEPVFEHVSRKIPARDVKRYVDDLFQATVHEFREALTANVVSDVDEASLEAAGYTELKEAAVSEDINRLYAGNVASYWQKEIWKVDDIDASTGFARIWMVADEEVAIVQPSSGDFDTGQAISRIESELRKETGA